MSQPSSKRESLEPKTKHLSKLTRLEKYEGKVKVKQSTYKPGQARRVPDSGHMKAVRLSALATGLFTPPGNVPGIYVCQKLSRPQGHSATERIKSIKNFNDPIGNRNRDLPACSAVPQPTAPRRAPREIIRVLM